MKVILLHDVARLGRRHTVIEVLDGFARNKLLPTKAAVPATPENLKRYTALTAHSEEQIKQSEAQLRESLQRLAAAPLQIKASTNGKGHLYKAISKEAIAAASNEAGAPLPASALQIATPIKTTGLHHVPVLSGNVRGEVVIEVLENK